MTFFQSPSSLLLSNDLTTIFTTSARLPTQTISSTTKSSRYPTAPSFSAFSPAHRALYSWHLQAMGLRPLIFALIFRRFCLERYGAGVAGLRKYIGCFIFFVSFFFSFFRFMEKWCGLGSGLWDGVVQNWDGMG